MHFRHASAALKRDSRCSHVRACKRSRRWKLTKFQPMQRGGGGAWLRRIARQFIAKLFNNRRPRRRLRNRPTRNRCPLIFRFHFRPSKLCLQLYWHGVKHRKFECFFSGEKFKLVLCFVCFFHVERRDSFWFRGRCCGLNLLVFS